MTFTGVLKYKYPMNQSTARPVSPVDTSMMSVISKCKVFASFVQFESRYQANTCSDRIRSKMVEFEYVDEVTKPHRGIFVVSEYKDTCDTSFRRKCGLTSKLGGILGGTKMTKQSQNIEINCGIIFFCFFFRGRGKML